LNRETHRGFNIISATLSTDRNDASIDISGSISDIDIYEHLDKPYLTGNMVFIDNYSIVQLLDIQGIEKLSLQLEAPETKNIILKDFRITKISKSIKGDDRSEVVVVDMMEEHAYISNAINVNKCYVGSPSTIISTVAQEFLSKNVLVRDTPYQSNIKVIVPNKNPIQTIKWIQQRATNQHGMPYYIYSILSDNDLRFNHLGAMLVQDPINKDKPYVWSQAPAKYGNSVNEYFVIEGYSYENTENMVDIINSGFSGANYQFYNALNGYGSEVHFDAKEDVFDNLSHNNYLKLNQNNYNYPVNSKISGNLINKQRSKTISRMSAMDVYTASGDYKTYGEEVDATAYKKNIVGNALKKYMTKTPISISIKGAPFIMGDTGKNKHMTIGSIIRLKFFDANIAVDRINNDIGIDTKKSGDYVIYAARHSFKLEKYDIRLLCAKIATYNGENL